MADHLTCVQLLGHLMALRLLVLSPLLLLVLAFHALVVLLDVMVAPGGGKLLVLLVLGNVLTQLLDLGCEHCNFAQE